MVDLVPQTGNCFVDNAADAVDPTQRPMRFHCVPGGEREGFAEGALGRGVEGLGGDFYPGDRDEGGARFGPEDGGVFYRHQGRVAAALDQEIEFGKALGEMLHQIEAQEILVGAVGEWGG